MSRLRKSLNANGKTVLLSLLLAVKEGRHGGRQELSAPKKRDHRHHLIQSSGKNESRVCGSGAGSCPEISDSPDQHPRSLREAATAGGDRRGGDRAPGSGERQLRRERPESGEVVDRARRGEEVRRSGRSARLAAGRR